MVESFREIFNTPSYLLLLYTDKHRYIEFTLSICRSTSQYVDFNEILHEHTTQSVDMHKGRLIYIGSFQGQIIYWRKTWIWEGYIL